MTNIYRDIATRTGGDIYVGVVGPVRTGKSTFIKRFMETLVLPNISDNYDRERAKDEMPQSAAGRTVMTTEPKFIPDEAVKISLDDVASLSVKMVDCVGYIVSDALGQTEEGKPRMVLTPWSSKPLPFGEAAEIGTKKVITDHSTIGFVVTTDGSVCDIPRSQYEDAERRVVSELRQMNKPFAIILNSAHPESPESEALALEIEARYGVPVALVNCMTLDSEDIRHILELVLLEFPISEISIDLPEWTLALESDHPIIDSLRKDIVDCAGKISKIGQIKNAFASLEENDYVLSATVNDIDLGNGRAQMAITLDPELYFKVISEMTGLEISDEETLIDTFKNLASIKAKYDRISQALSDAESKGYGIIVPEIEDMHLEEPKLVKHSGGYGVRLKASAPSIHMIKATLETEINPVVGSEQQSEDLIKYLLSEFDEDPTKIWGTNLFGKTLHELVNEGLLAKLANVPDNAREKLSETLSRIVNEGSGGLICIIL
ncbi:MAG: stage IV sporulation protein A [Clostridia bacterium]|nr:stage IV sporulation protein A [Clostridia bacterium]MBR3714546.1 stage IV sporulation protein A [Clostridia bacterium]